MNMKYMRACVVYVAARAQFVERLNRAHRGLHVPTRPRDKCVYRHIIHHTHKPRPASSSSSSKQPSQANTFALRADLYVPLVAFALAGVVPGKMIAKMRQVSTQHTHKRITRR